MDKHLPSHSCVATPVHGSVLELPWLERTLLWSIRTWAAYHDAPQAVRLPLESVFNEAGIHPALEPFSQLMLCVFSGLRRLPDIRCVRCLRLGKDEQALLQVLANAVDAPQYAIELHFKHWLLPAAARTAAEAAQEMMQLVRNAGLHMQQAQTAAPSWPPATQMLSTTRH